MVLPNPPIVEIFEFNTNEIASPVGNRHIEGGSFAFVQKISLGCNQYTGLGTSGVLMFQGVKFNVSQPVSHISSKVHAITLRLATSGLAISDIKLFLSNGSALSGSLDYGLDPIRMQFAVSGIWQPNTIWPSGITQEIPQLIPTFPNVFRQDGFNGMNGNQDIDSSQFIYLNLIVPLGFPLGNFGICGSGLVRMGFIYDYFN